VAQTHAKLEKHSDIVMADLNCSQHPRHLLPQIKVKLIEQGIGLQHCLGWFATYDQ
jgi:hypothetical protein